MRNLNSGNETADGILILLLWKKDLRCSPGDSIISPLVLKKAGT